MNWEVISMNLISSLTPSTHAIFMCVDKFFKMTHFLPTTTHVIAKQIARLFGDHVYKLHGLPKVNLSYRNTRFTNRF